MHTKKYNTMENNLEKISATVGILENKEEKIIKSIFSKKAKYSVSFKISSLSILFILFSEIIKVSIL